MTTDGREMTQRDSVEPFGPGTTDPTFVAPVVPDDSIAPAAPIPPPLPTQRPNFCSTCGSPWDPASDRCAPCDARFGAVGEGAVRAAPAASFAFSGQLAPPDERRFGRAGLTAAISLYFALLVVGMIGLGLAFNNDYTATTDINLTIAFAAVTLAWCLAAFKDVGPALLRIGPLRWYAAAVPAAVVTFAIATGACELLHRVLGIPVLEYSPVILEGGYGWSAVVLLVAVCPGVFEELAFRGVVLPGMQKVLTPGEAIAVSALLFMTLHLAVASFPHLLLIGLALGFLRVRTGSLYPGMVLHFTHNLLCVAAERFAA